MTDRRHDNYPGFGDENDFLPDQFSSSEQDQRLRERSDTREWTGGRRRMKIVPKLLLILLIAAALLIVLNATLMKIRHIRVLGNRSVPADVIAVQAGLNRDLGFFTVDGKRVQEKLEQNPYLEFVELRKVFPDTLVLIVKERAPCANAQGAGSMYLIDENAYVLQTYDTVTPQNTLPVVIGLRVSEAKPGRRIVSSRDGKIKEYCDIMQELLLQGVVAEFDQINLTDSNHLYLRYQDGFVAELGTLNELMAKIGTLRAVVAELRANGLGSGYIDVSIPGEAVYTPE